MFALQCGSTIIKQIFKLKGIPITFMCFFAMCHVLAFILQILLKSFYLSTNNYLLSWKSPLPFCAATGIRPRVQDWWANPHGWVSSPTLLLNCGHYQNQFLSPADASADAFAVTAQFQCHCWCRSQPATLLLS
jgi:hypothetical protein